MASVALPDPENSETVVASGFIQQTEQRIRNDAQSINKLPIELLSHIFGIGEASERSSRPRTCYYIPFQEIITVSMFAIDGGSPYHLVSLYLERSGSTRLLDIDLEMRKRFWRVVAIETRDWEAQLKKVPYLLKFLISRGATVDRWRSLTVCAKQPEVLYAVIGFVNAQPARALRSLSCRWKVRGYNSDIEELRSLDYPHLFSDSYSFSAPTTPELRYVEFDAIPWGYVFNRPSPIFTGLKKLTLTSSYAPCSPGNLYKLLTSNPELEELSLGISKRAAHEFQNEIEPGPDDFHVCLPYLRSLSFATSSLTTWVLCVIERIEAPALERLSVSGRFKSSPEGTRLADHFMRGLPIVAGAEAGSDDSSTRTKSIHPLLDELDISKLTMTPVGDPLVGMLSSLTTITKLSVSGNHIRQLRKMPHVLPNLSHVYCSRVSYRQLGDMLRRRANAGSPIQVVHLDQTDFQGAIGLHLPENIKYVRYYCNSRSKLDHDESDPESGDDGGQDEDILGELNDDESISDADSSASDST
ncbi:hypothetical protein FRC11_003027 [Ceratobasidium sp. 423]|nr:hypothetical protein FRC11_003027 [Ceratobasidium sp. 423]